MIKVDLGVYVNRKINKNHERRKKDKKYNKNISNFKKQDMIKRAKEQIKIEKELEILFAKIELKYKI